MSLSLADVLGSFAEDDVDPERLYAYMDILIGRDMGKNPELTRGRLIFELFDDIMPVRPVVHDSPL